MFQHNSHQIVPLQSFDHLELLEQQREEIRKEAFLPFEEKRRILIRMQEGAAGMRPDLHWTVWRIPESYFGDRKNTD